ncbi:hypothetical protein [Sphingomonas sp. R86520]|uniref:hypothetical protein n=1 Tax=Sphingomonas sp. R86520 TaxID=3093859 RepID=UPI0036D32C28
MKEYLHAHALLKEAADVAESVGDTLLAAHIATPLAMLEDRLYPHVDLTNRNRPAQR